MTRFYNILKPGTINIVLQIGQMLSMIEISYGQDHRKIVPQINI